MEGLKGGSVVGRYDKDGGQWGCVELKGYNGGLFCCLGGGSFEDTMTLRFINEKSIRRSDAGTMGSDSWIFGRRSGIWARSKGYSA